MIDVGGTGGAETVFIQLLRRFEASGNNAAIVLPGGGWIHEQLAGISTPVRHIASKGSASVRLVGSLIATARRFGANVIIAHLLGSAVYAAIVGWLLRCPVIAVFHGALDIEQPGRFASVKKRLLGMRHVSIVAVSDSVKDALVSWGIDPGTVEVIPNGVDTQKFKRVSANSRSQALGLPMGAIVVGAVGNLHPVKGYECLMRAAATISLQNQRVVFLVAGEGEPDYVRHLMRQRDELGLQGKFHFLGYLDADSAHYSSLSVFVSAALSEGLPLSFLEAMACSVPIVATANDGSSSLLKKAECGIVVPVGNPDAMAEAILSLTNDPDFARALGNRGRNAVKKHYSLSLSQERYWRLVQRISPRTDS
jgi:glycosyltransferase involved in cell wall biosynthesis